MNRSDDSGTTTNFTDYLAAAAPEVWTDKAAGVWPATLQGENAKGTSGVVKTVTDTPGAVTYADDSAVSGKLGIAQIKVGETFTKISAEAAAKAVDAGKPVEGRNANDLAIKLDRTTTIDGRLPDRPGVLPHRLLHLRQRRKPLTWSRPSTTTSSPTPARQAAADAAKSAPLSKDLQDKAKASIESIKVKS